MSPARLTRAGRLLLQVVAMECVDRKELARELVITPRLLDSYLAGRSFMPLERQLCLALFVMERIPPLARYGRQLRGQVAGAMAFEERARGGESFAVSRLRPRSTKA